MIRNSIYVKIEAEGRDIESKAKLKISLTSELKMDKLEVNGIRGSDIAKEMLTLADLISEKIHIDYDTLTTSKTNSTLPKRVKKEEELIDDELAEALGETTQDLPVSEAKPKAKLSLFAQKLRKK